MRLDDLITRALDEHDAYTNAALAALICETEPEAVEQYLHAHRVMLVADIVAARGRSRRSWTAANRPRSVFAQAVEDGPEAVAEWQRGFGAAAFAVNDENLQKKVSRMTKADCQYVAEAYFARSRENALMGEVFAVLARRLPKGKEVGDVYSEAELEALRSRVLGAAA